MPVGTAEGFHEASLLGGRVRAVCRQDCPAQQGAGQRQDDSDVYERRTPGTYGIFQNPCHLRSRESGHFLGSHNPKAENGGHNIDGQDADKGGD